MKIIPPIYERLRLTIPAREALQAGRNKVIRIDVPPSVQFEFYDIDLVGVVPDGIVSCLIGPGGDQHRGLRLADEPEYPGEWKTGGIAWYEHGQWVPCPAPRCGRALVWYEAGYVPGYRMCTAGHHARLSDDGRSARVV